MLEPFLAKNHCHQFAANLGETFNLCKGSTCSTNTNIMKNLEKPQHTWRNIQIPPFQPISGHYELSPTFLWAPSNAVNCALPAIAWSSQRVRVPKSQGSPKGVPRESQGSLKGVRRVPVLDRQEDWKSHLELHLQTPVLQKMVHIPYPHVLKWGWVKTLVPSEPQNSW